MAPSELNSEGADFQDIPPGLGFTNPVT